MKISCMHVNKFIKIHLIIRNKIIQYSPLKLKLKPISSMGENPLHDMFIILLLI